MSTPVLLVTGFLGAGKTTAINRLLAAGHGERIAAIVNDFGADSLDVIDMITVLSDEFGVEIPDEDIENFHTVGDVVNYLEDRM